MDDKIIIDGPYLDDEERDLMESLDHEDWVPLEGSQLNALEMKLQEAAKNTLSEIENKTERMNIRMTRRDMEALKEVAAREAIPYQTLVTSILHKFTAGRLVDIDEARKLFIQR